MLIFESKKLGELDFIVQNGMDIDLLEIKSGSDYKKHPALNHVSETSNWKFGKKYVFCKGNVERQGEIIYLPWYMIMFYKMDEPEELVYTVDLSALML